MKKDSIKYYAYSIIGIFSIILIKRLPYDGDMLSYGIVGIINLLSLTAAGGALERITQEKQKEYDDKKKYGTSGMSKIRHSK